VRHRHLELRFARPSGSRFSRDKSVVRPGRVASDHMPITAFNSHTLGLDLNRAIAGTLSGIPISITSVCRCGRDRKSGFSEAADLHLRPGRRSSQVLYYRGFSRSDDDTIRSRKAASSMCINEPTAALLSMKAVSPRSS
jgi:hypothetical protein